MKAGRNDPCPCGSGKKFKKCCLTKSESAVSVALGNHPGDAPSPPLSRQISQESSPPPAVVAPKPPPRQRTPAEERGEERWNEFESQKGEGRSTSFCGRLTTKN